MKKNILFIIPGLGAGGGEKSLINLLSEFDYSKYNVDLMLLNKEGLFINSVPKEVNILDVPSNLEIFNLKLPASIASFIKKGKLSLAYNRLLFFMKNRLIKNNSIAEQKSWKNLRQAIGVLEKEYDVAIGYLEKTSNYLCVDSVKAKKKIGWIHTDYRKLNLSINFEIRYLKKFNYIVTVSEKCAEVLSNLDSRLDKKIRVINNIISSNTIKSMAKDKVDIKKTEDEHIIVSIGRLSFEKGFDIAIKAGKILKDNGIKFKWYVVGDGKERKPLEGLILENNLEKEFILLGATTNPYKYLSKADIYVQPSRFEGKSIAIEEAKILGKPIVTTRFTTVNDQITNKVNGLITEINEDSLSSGIDLLVKDNILKSAIEKNLNKINLNVEKELSKIYKLME